MSVPRIEISDDILPLQDWLIDVQSAESIEYLDQSGARAIELHTSAKGSFLMTAGYFDLCPRGSRGFLEFRRPIDRKTWAWGQRPLRIDTVFSNQVVQKAQLLNLDTEGVNCIAGIRFAFEDGTYVEIICAAFIVHLALFGATTFDGDADAEYADSYYRVFQTFSA